MFQPKSLSMIRSGLAIKAAKLQQFGFRLFCERSIIIKAFRGEGGTESDSAFIKKSTSSKVQWNLAGYLRVRSQRISRCLRNVFDLCLLLLLHSNTIEVAFRENSNYAALSRENGEKLTEKTAIQKADSLKLIKNKHRQNVRVQTRRDEEENQ